MGRPVGRRMTDGAGLLLGLTILCTISGTLGHAIGKRSVGSETAVAEYPDYEYQRVMPKRAALLLDRLLVALQKAVENDELGREGKSYGRSLPDFSDMPDSSRMHLSDEKTMDLQRRGQQKGRVYWRCYFNAVTCFKRK